MGRPAPGMHPRIPRFLKDRLCSSCKGRNIEALNRSPLSTNSPRNPSKLRAVTWPVLGLQVTHSHWQQLFSPSTGLYQATQSHSLPTMCRSALLSLCKHESQITKHRHSRNKLQEQEFLMATSPSTTLSLSGISMHPGAAMFHWLLV